MGTPIAPMARARCSVWQPIRRKLRQLRPAVWWRGLLLQFYPQQMYRLRIQVLDRVRGTCLKPLRDWKRRGGRHLVHLSNQLAIRTPLSRLAAEDDVQKAGPAVRMQGLVTPNLDDYATPDNSGNSGHFSAPSRCAGCAPRNACNFDLHGHKRRTASETSHRYHPGASSRRYWSHRGRSRA